MRSVASGPRRARHVPSTDARSAPGARAPAEGALLHEVVQHLGPIQVAESRALESVLGLAAEMAREGREGQRIGTIFMIGDVARIRAAARDLIYDPLRGHPREARRIDVPAMRETAKELARLDGGFILDGDGVFEFACQLFTPSAAQVPLPLGLGARHAAAAATSAATGAVAVVVSESAVVRLFLEGQLRVEILQERALLRSYHTLIEGRTRELSTENLVVVEWEGAA